MAALHQHISSRGNETGDHAPLQRPMPLREFLFHRLPRLSLVGASVVGIAGTLGCEMKNDSPLSSTTEEILRSPQDWLGKRIEINVNKVGTRIIASSSIG